MAQSQRVMEKYAPDKPFRRAALPQHQHLLMCVYRYLEPHNTTQTPDFIQLTSLSIPGITSITTLFVRATGDVFKLMHCVPCLPPGRLVAVPGAGLLRVPHVDPTLLAEKAAAAADSTLATSFKTHMENAGVSCCICRKFLRNDQPLLCQAMNKHAAVAIWRYLALRVRVCGPSYGAWSEAVHLHDT